MAQAMTKHIGGTWCSGITPAQHVGGPGLNPQCVHGSGNHCNWHISTAASAAPAAFRLTLEHSCVALAWHSAGGSAPPKRTSNSDADNATRTVQTTTPNNSITNNTNTAHQNCKNTNNQFNATPHEHLAAQVNLASAETRTAPDLGGRASFVPMCLLCLRCLRCLLCLLCLRWRLCLRCLLCRPCLLCHPCLP